jgi:hypothetical protein
MEVALSPVRAEVAPSPVHAEPPAGGRVEPCPQMEDFAGVEDYLRAYLEGERFKSMHLRAYECWSDASAMLWRADSSDGLVAVGNAALGAIREFTGALSGGTLAAGADSTATQARLSAAIETHTPQLARSRREFLDGLVDYWRTLYALVQRHDGAPAVGERLRWEDARRVVVLTALVMVEVDRSL